jgi:NitT/TauT family transport system permease protein
VHRLFAIRKELPPAWERLLGLAAFLLPLGLWCLVSYCPAVWHPLVKVQAPGAVAWFAPGLMVEKDVFLREHAKASAAHAALPSGVPANPIFLPAPHEVGRALYTAFTTPPRLRGDTWLHESLWTSIQTILWGFLISSLLGVPLGILCGSYAFWARLHEPFIDFLRYMPAPAFGALAVAVLGIYQAPKVAIIVIGTFFQQVLVVSNTVRKVDPALLEAAQTLGAPRRGLLLQVIVPSSLPDLYNDLRILLGWAWTYLIVAEVVGVSSGITYFINQQAKYRLFENVYAAILIIGFIGLATDQALGFLGRRLFPWKDPRPSRFRRALLSFIKAERVLNASPSRTPVS